MKSSLPSICIQRQPPIIPALIGLPHPFFLHILGANGRSCSASLRHVPKKQTKHFSLQNHEFKQLHFFFFSFIQSERRAKSPRTTHDLKWLLHTCETEEGD